MQILFHPDAQEELNRAISHYKSIEPSLGLVGIEEEGARLPKDRDSDETRKNSAQ
jgi:hypothetical protein